MAAIDDALAAGTTYMTTLVRVTARTEMGGDDVRIALHSEPITFETLVYDPAPLVSSQFAAKSGVEPGSGTITHLLNAIVTRQGMTMGKWGGARVEVIQLDYRHPEWGAAKRMIGRIGDAALKGLQSESNFVGLMDLLNQAVGERTSMPCRYVLGEIRCGVILSSFTVTGRSVVSVTNRQRFLSNLAGPPADGYYADGLIIWTSGPNTGLHMETIINVGATIVLFQPMVADIAAGHQFSIIAGDDKSLATCHTKFNNAINFGGEPNSPTRDSIFTIP